MDKPSAPSIQPATASLFAILFTVIYIAPFYLSPTLRTSPLASRDDPDVIKARVQAVGVTCVVCTIISSAVLATYGHASLQNLLRLYGIWPFAAVDIVKILILLAVLFVGPLYESLIVEQDWRGWSFPALKAGVWDSWTGYRNYIIGPASEEVVFRAVAIPLFLLADIGPARVVFLTPIIFGLAHLHHLVDFLHSRTPPGHRWPSTKVWAAGIVRSVVQFTYTSLFGFFAAFVLLRTGNLWAAIAAHTFCNWQGLPRISGKIGQFADRQAADETADVIRGTRINGDNQDITKGQTEQKAENLSIGWTIVYYALLGLGAAAFYKLLWPLTESSNALAAFD